MRLALPFCVALASCSGEAPAPELGSRALPVLGGEKDDTHEAVVAIQTKPGVAAGELCTGTVIAPRVVLTAAHCLIGVAPADLQVFVGSDTTTARALSVLRLVKPDRYVNEKELNERGLDVGALILGEDAGVAPLPIARTAPPSSARLVGYGMISFPDGARGVRRAVDVPITSQCSTLVTFGTATANACHGDSGGPLLVSGAIAAIVSYGDPGCAGPSAAVRVDAYAAFLDALVAGKEDLACTTCPPPGEDCVSGADAGVDAAPSAEAGPEATSTGGGSCAYARGDTTAAWLLLALAFARRARITWSG
ncbi:MAG: S1 family peptidase [Polyangiales bacterium]